MPNNPFFDEAVNTFDSKPGDSITCIACSNLFVRGQWNFYDLCDVCMDEYHNARKMVTPLPIKWWLEQRKREHG
jgi:hypothetical protein